MFYGTATHTKVYNGKTKFRKFRINFVLNLYFAVFFNDYFDYIQDFEKMMAEHPGDILPVFYEDLKNVSNCFIFSMLLKFVKY